MQQRSYETRNNILTAAIETFMKNGYEAASVSQICQTAGVSKGAFYHHFPSKQSVFQQAMDEWLDSLDEQLNLTRQKNLTIPETLAEMGTMMPQVYQAAGGFLPMFLEFWQHAYREPEMLEAVTSPHKRYHRFFLEMIEQGMDEGTIQDTDPEMAARVFVSLAIGLLLGGLVDPEAADWPKTAQHGIQLLIKGLTRREI